MNFNMLRNIMVFVDIIVSRGRLIVKEFDFVDLSLSIP